MSNQTPPQHLFAQMLSNLAQRVDVLYQMFGTQNETVEGMRRVVLMHGYRHERIEAWAASGNVIE